MASGSYFNFVIPCDKYLPIPENKTFWDEGQYDATVKRLENGKRSLDDFLLMVGERAAIERRYADKLQSWYKKWSVAVKQGPEFGEIEDIWQSILTEGRKIADIHFKISSGLGITHSEGIQKSIHKFRKSHYHNVPLQKELKEVKECRETFRSIQAPYKKALEHLNKLKKKYFDLSKNFLQLNSKLKKSAVSEHQPNAKRDSLSNAKDQAKLNYMKAFSSFNENIVETYKRSMKEEFDRCQGIESDRLTALLNSLHDYIGVVNQQVHIKEPLSNIYSQAVFPLNVAKPEQNLNSFAKLFGSSMPRNFPKFEDADLEPIRSQLLSGASTSRLFSSQLRSPGVLFSRLKHLTSDSQQFSSTARVSTKEFMLRRPSLAESLNGPSARNSEFKDAHMGIRPKRSFDSTFKKPPLSVTSSSNDDDVPSINQDHYDMSNVYVRAVSSFNATQRNHLDIKKGEVIYQIRGDRDGWCFGRIAFKEGIYPSNAVKLLTMNLFAI